MPHPLRPLHALALLALLFAFAPAARPALAQTYTVTNTNESGTGSLFAAITAANGNTGPDTIDFAIGTAPNTGGYVWTITLATTSLPALIGGGTTINGPLTADGKPRIEIRGQGRNGPGIAITSAGNTVRGLIINGFAGPTETGVGVSISGPGASGNRVEKNYIGTNYLGNAVGFVPAEQNQDNGGVVIVRGANTNVIDSNVIAGNGSITSSYGVYIGPGLSQISGTNGNTISNNRIGVDATGAVAVPNAGSGVYVGDGSNNNIIGPGNVISGNGRNASVDYGVVVVGKQDAGVISGNRVRGNLIGTNAAGTAAVPNVAGGVLVDYSQGTVVGGANAATSASDDRGNIIAGNPRYNVLVTNTDATRAQFEGGVQITNNYIGLGLSGAAALGSAPVGVRLERRVAGVTLSGNVISGHATAGVEISAGTTAEKTRTITVSNNRIGTNAAGTAPLGAQNWGVQLLGATTSNVISGNVISGNRAGGVQLTFSTGSGAPQTNTLSNNVIGGLLGGNTAVGNGLAGVVINDGSGNVVGPLNTITKHSDGQSGDGVLIQGSTTTGNRVIGNTISENFYGVRIDGDSPANTIGGSAAGEGNTLRNNAQGILVNGAGSVGNRITRTTATGHPDPGTGIALFTGGNGEIAAPSVSGLAFSNGTLSGSVSSPADCSGAGCVVEIFQNTVQENQEGKYFLASFTKTGAGAFSWSVPVASCMPWLTFTITDKDGNTSPFSNAVQGPAGCNAGEPTGSAAPDLSDPTPATQTIASGAFSFSSALRNVGTGAGSFSLSVSGLPAGWGATVNPAQAANVAPNGAQSVPVTVSGSVPANTDAGEYVATLTATTDGGGPSDSVQARIVVPLVPALSFSPASPSSQTAGPGQQVCYNHTLTNQGNGADTFRITVTPPAGWQSSVQPGTLVQLGRGEQRTVTVCVTVPAGNTAAGSYTTTVVASSESGSKPSAPAVTDTTVVQPAAVPEVSAAPAQSVDPGQSATFTHQISNVGNASAIFALSVTGLPAGWTISGPPATVGPITPGGAPVNVTYTVAVPAGAPAGPVSLTFTATAQDANGASKSVTDLLTVNQVPNIQLSADQSSDEDPDSTRIYTFTLTNGGNFNDQVTLSLEVSQAGWSATVPAPTVTVAAGASVQVGVSVVVPPGVPANTVNVTRLIATSSAAGANSSDTAQATTRVRAVPKVKITPEQQSKSATQGQTVTFDFTLQNNGSVNQQFTTAVVSSDPADLEYTFTPNDPSEVFAPGETAPLRLVVVVPNDTPDGTTFTVTLRATSDQNVTADAVARVRVGPPFDVLIEPDLAQDALPGALVQYTHYVTNTGTTSDTFVLSTLNTLGWESTVSPSSVRLDPGDDQLVTVTVQVPSSADAGAINTTTVTARSVGDATVSDIATDRTRVLQVAGISFGPSRTTVLVPGRSPIFSHTLINAGNGTDTFVVTATQELDWEITVAPILENQTPRLARGVSYPIQLQVKIPGDVDPNIPNRITLRAVSKLDGSVFAEVVDVIRPVTTAAFGVEQLFLPLVAP